MNKKHFHQGKTDVWGCDLFNTVTYVVLVINECVNVLSKGSMKESSNLEMGQC